MQKFLVLYRSQMSMGERMASTTPEERQSSMDAWMAWGAAAGEALVDWGVPTQPTSDEAPGPAGWVGGYSILQAADVDAVRAVLPGHPHNQIGSIEILQMLDMPGSQPVTEARSVRVGRLPIGTYRLSGRWRD
jgi:hypothetical protein